MPLRSRLGLCVVRSFVVLIAAVVCGTVSVSVGRSTSRALPVPTNVTVATSLLPAAGGLAGGAALAPSAGAASSLTSTGTLTTFLAPSIIDLPQSSGPPARKAEAVAFDAARNQTVLFGGANSAGNVASATYTFDGDAWSVRAPTTLPTARQDAVLVYDPATANTVLFGGINQSGVDLGDTWVWDGSNWTQKAGTAPSAREGAQAEYLPSLGKVVLFGGKASGTFKNDTWTWNGTAWTQLSPSASPPARAEGGLAYGGSTNGNLVLYGGQGASGVLATPGRSTARTGRRRRRRARRGR